MGVIAFPGDRRRIAPREIDEVGRCWLTGASSMRRSREGRRLTPSI